MRKITLLTIAMAFISFGAVADKTELKGTWEMTIENGKITNLKMTPTEAPKGDAADHKAHVDQATSKKDNATLFDLGGLFSSALNAGMSILGSI